jgi:hypothetical protein
MLKSNLSTASANNGYEFVCGDKTATIDVDYTVNPFGTGGVVAGGNATAVETVNVTTTGGVVLGNLLPILATGGVVIGASATPTGSMSVQGTGGALAGGATVLSESEFVSGAGGELMGGTAPWNLTLSQSSIGGVVIAGAVTQQMQFNVVASGGVRLGSGYRYVRKITLAPPATSEGFLVLVAVQLDPVKVGYPSFFFTDTNKKPLPFDFRSYTADGVLTALVKSRAATGQQIVLYYGANA